MDGWLAPQILNAYLGGVLKNSPPPFLWEGGKGRAFVICNAESWGGGGRRGGGMWLGCLVDQGLQKGRRGSKGFLAPPPLLTPQDFFSPWGEGLVGGLAAAEFKGMQGGRAGRLWSPPPKPILCFPLLHLAPPPTFSPLNACLLASQGDSDVFPG